MEEQVKIIRGYYLTGLGQEPDAYYFKIKEGEPKFTTVQNGDVALTFYQNGSVITSIPAVIRIDSVIANEKLVQDYLNSEQRDGYPMLSIVHVFETEQFDPLLAKKVMDGFGELKNEIKNLAKVAQVQSTIFDFLNEEED